MTAETKSPKRKKSNKYEDVLNQTENISPYTFDVLLFHVGHADFTKAIIESLKNRKDFDDLIVSAAFRSGRFWSRIVSVILAISISANCLFYYFPKRIFHIIEKTINSKVPELLPLPEELPGVQK